MNSDIENLIRDCPSCAEFQNQQTAEPLKPINVSHVINTSYNMVGDDLFDFESKKYLLIVDFYSKYKDVLELSETTSTSVINSMKSIFACHCIPQILRSDNGPQYSSLELKNSMASNTKLPVLIFKVVMGKQNALYKLLNVYGRIRQKNI